MYFKKTIQLIISVLFFISFITFQSFADIDEQSIQDTIESVDELPENSTIEYFGKCKLTAYCPCKSCSGKWGKQTSSGATCQPKHTVAVDTKVIPHGTKLLIDGVVYVAEDTGGGVNGNHIDIYFETHEETDNFGLKKDVDVYIVK